MLQRLSKNHAYINNTTATTFNITFEINEIRVPMRVFSNTTMVERPWSK